MNDIAILFVAFVVVLTLSGCDGNQSSNGAGQNDTPHVDANPPPPVITARATPSIAVTAPPRSLHDHSIDELVTLLINKGIRFELKYEDSGRIQLGSYDLDGGTLPEAKMELLRVLDEKSYGLSWDLSRIDATDALLAQLAELRSSSEVFLDDLTQVTDAGLESIAKMQQVELISLRSEAPTPITNEGLKKLANIPALDRLSVDCGTVDSDGSFLAAFIEHPQLKYVTLWDASHVTDAGLAQIKTLPNLQWLEIDRAPINGSGLGFLQHSPEVSELKLPASAVTDEMLAWIEDSGVRMLRAWPQDPKERSQVTDRGLKSLGTIAPLSHLYLRRAEQITDRGLASLGNISVLALPGAKQITDAGVAQLVKNAPGIETLELDDCPNLTDESLAAIATLQDLYIFSMENTLVTDRGLAHLSSLPKLYDVDLRGTQVTPQGVEQFKAKARNLQRIEFDSP